MTPRRPTVLLEHTLPDGSSHFDWMRARDGDALLVTYRLTERLDHLEAGASITAERIDDHRAVYLTFEGPLSPGADGEDRGAVRRVADGILRDGPDATLLVSWSAEPGDHTLVIEPAGLIRRLS